MLSRYRLLFRNVIFSAKLRLVFSSRTIMKSLCKYSMPVFKINSVICSFKGQCEAEYIGSTTQPLERRISQYVSVFIRRCQLFGNSHKSVTSGRVIVKYLINNRQYGEVYWEKILWKSHCQFKVNVLENFF